MRLRKPRPVRLPLAAVLAASFGIMLVITLACVLFLSFSAGISNTRDLLADRTNLLMFTLGRQVTNFLDPIEPQLRFVAEAVGNGRLGPDTPEAVPALLQPLFASNPQLTGFAFIGTDQKGWHISRNDAAPIPEDWSRVPAMVKALQEGRQQLSPAWGDPAWASGLDSTVLHARLPVRHEGSYLGMVFAAVALGRLVEYVDRISTEIRLPVFILQGSDRVVAVPGLDTRALGPGKPLPSLAESGDAVLAAMARGRERRAGILGDKLSGDAHQVNVQDARFVVFTKSIKEYGDQPWIVGTYLPAEVAGAELARLRRAILLSLALVVLAMIVARWLGHRMARPVEQLAQTARRIQRLDVANLPDLPPSHIRELNQASEAFNAMRGALSWFETYLPRRLVRQLMRDPSPDGIASRQAEVTVLFTDIVGFSTMAERLDAVDAAELLNQHFELLAGCIAEQDGTIDKYVGDSIMAFWGAPGLQPNHAERAVRAALAMRECLVAAKGHQHVRLRIGIHTGPALVGNIGARDRLNYTMVGDTVNIAQRLEQLGKEIATDQQVAILLSETTVAALPPDLPVRPLGRFALRGRSELVAVFTLPDRLSAAA